MQPGSSGQRRRQHRAEALSMDGDPPQPAHQTAEDALFFVVIAVADPTRPAWRQILAARNRNRKRAVASVVCWRVSTLASSSRLNSISQQFRLQASIATWKWLQFIIHRPDG